MLACLALAPRASGELRFTIWNAPATRLQSHKPVAPIPPGFVGASIAYCSIPQYNPGGTANRVLANLLANLAPQEPLLRVGGDGPEAPCAGHKPQSVSLTLAAIRALAQALHAKLILGINLEAHRADVARSEVATLVRSIDRPPADRYIAAFEIGNEPDLYPQYGPDALGSQIAGYFSRYLRDFMHWSAIVRQVTKDPDFPIAGPSLGRLGWPWITGSYAGNFATLVDGPARPQYVTFHAYPLFGKNDPCPDSTCASIEHLLSDSSSHGLAEGLAAFASRIPSGREFRVDEMNSITNSGTPGVSDTFASALWALDTLFEMARAGVDGVNVHTASGAAYALFSHPSPGRWFVHPEYYGLLMFARAAPAGSQLLRVTPDLAASGGTNVKVWATRGADGTSRIVIVNKDIARHDVVLAGPGLPITGTARLEVLRAPGAAPTNDCPAVYSVTGLCATGGVMLGNRTFGVRAGGQGGGDATSDGLLAAPGGNCRLDGSFPADCVVRILKSGTTIPLPAGSAAMLTGDWSLGWTPAGDRNGARVAR